MGRREVTLGADAGSLGGNFIHDVYGTLNLGADWDRVSLDFDVAAIGIERAQDVSQGRGEGLFAKPNDTSANPYQVWVHKWYLSGTFRYGELLNDDLKLSDAETERMKKYYADKAPKEEEYESVAIARMKLMQKIGEKINGLLIKEGALKDRLLVIANIQHREKKEKEATDISITEFFSHYFTAARGVYGGNPLNREGASNYITSFNDQIASLAKTLSEDFGEDIDIALDYEERGDKGWHFGKVGLKNDGTYDLGDDTKIQAAHAECERQLEFLEGKIVERLWLADIGEVEGKLKKAAAKGGENKLFELYRQLKLQGGSMDCRTHLSKEDFAYRYRNQVDADVPNAGTYGLCVMASGGYAFGNEWPVFAVLVRGAVARNGHPKWVMGEGFSYNRHGTVLTGDLLLRLQPFKEYNHIAAKLLAYGSVDTSGENVGEKMPESARGLIFNLLLGDFDLLGIPTRLVPGFLIGKTEPYSREHFAAGINVSGTLLSRPVDAGVDEELVLNVGANAGRFDDKDPLSLGNRTSDSSFGNTTEDFPGVDYGSGAGSGPMMVQPGSAYGEFLLSAEWENMMGVKGLSSSAGCSLLLSDTSTRRDSSTLSNPVQTGYCGSNLEYEF